MCRRSWRPHATGCLDVRMLVPGSSDIPAVAGISRTGYRPLLKAGIRVFEWNGSMLHAKTAVADGQWARVGSSNLNIASWLGNCEVDVAVEDAGFAGVLAAQYELDLQNATEIVLAPRRYRGGEHIQGSGTRPPRVPYAGGSSGRAAAGALRIANSVGAVLTNRRVLGDVGGGPLVTGTLVCGCHCRRGGVLAAGDCVAARSTGRMDGLEFGYPGLAPAGAAQARGQVSRATSFCLNLESTAASAATQSASSLPGANPRRSARK